MRLLFYRIVFVTAETVLPDPVHVRYFSSIAPRQLPDSSHIAPMDDSVDNLTIAHYSAGVHFILEINNGVYLLIENYGYQFRAHI